MVTIDLKGHHMGKLALGEGKRSLQVLSQNLSLLVCLDCSQNLEKYTVKISYYWFNYDNLLSVTMTKHNIV